MKRQNLVTVNSTEKCEGVITRYKKTVGAVEKSVSDYFLVCRDLCQNIVKMKIEEDRQYVLSRWIKELNHLIAISFKKIRISNSNLKPNKNAIDLMKIREGLKLKISKLKNGEKTTIREEQIQKMTLVSKHEQLRSNKFGSGYIL